MWSTHNIGNLPLNQQSSPVENPITSSQFTPGSLGMFHPQSEVSPPFSSGNTNPNSNPGILDGFLFGWNLNSNSPHGKQNGGLAYNGSSSHTLGNKSSLSNVGANPPLGM